MKRWQLGVAICLPLVVLGALLLNLRSETARTPAPVYLTQAQQDSRQHLVGRENYPEVDKARQYGANAKVTLRVVDSKGVPVPQAQVEVAFFPQDSYEAAEITKGLTDSKGQFSVSGKTVDDISFSASKDDFYITNRKFHFYWRGTECVKDGRWQPWNPTLEVVLKEKQKPIPLYTKQSELSFPKGSVVGFDCMLGELVAPHGKGKREDFQVLFSLDAKDGLWLAFRYTLTFRFPNPFDGVYRMKKDKWSALKSSIRIYR